MRRRLRHLLGGDQRGLAAVEFALLAPLLVTAYVATAEASLALIAQRKLSLSASIAADLASHSSTINAATVNGIFEATAAVLEPFAADGLVQRLSAIVVDPDGTARIAWSVGNGITAHPVGSPIVLPANLVDVDEGVVMAEAWLDYTSPMAFTLPGTRQFSQTHFVFPRVNDRVLWE